MDTLGQCFVALALAAVLASGLTAAQEIHSITDISHEFSFFFDGRFAAHYIESVGGKDVRNWATVSKIDLTNANLFIAQQGGTPCPWTPNDRAALTRFVRTGGGLLITGSWNLFEGEKDYKLDALSLEFGARILPNGYTKPLRADASLATDKIESYNGNIIQLENPAVWRILVSDAEGKVLMASRSFGRGRVIIGSNALFAHKPDFSDPINKGWIAPLMRWLAAGKDVAGLPMPKATKPENEVNDRGLRVQFNDYMAPSAQGISEWYFKCYPQVRSVTGVDPSPGNLLSLQLLPTGGGGFSTGETIGIGAYWGGFPNNKYGMVELIGHEMTHSWVHPFAEPMWNESIATYVGILIAKRLGFQKEADESLAIHLRNSQAQDPTGRADLNKDTGHAVRMGKPMLIFEELRKAFGDDIIARYFRAKRDLIKPSRGKYTADDAVAVMSRAVGHDLFPRLKELGTSVDWSNTDISSIGLKEWVRSSSIPPAIAARSRT